MATHCPKCFQDLNNALARYFWDRVGDIDPNEFEYLCPNCHTPVRVEVATVPEFTVRPIRMPEPPVDKRGE